MRKGLQKIRIFSNIFNRFTSFFKYFQSFRAIFRKFSNVFILPRLPNRYNLTPSPSILTQKLTSPSEESAKNHHFPPILDNFSSKFQRRKPGILHPTRISSEQLDLQKICIVISSLICNIWRSLVNFACSLLF